MSEYTAEDFANARFAEHENGRAAMRPQPGRLWHLGSVHMDDYGMAADGWRPVVEADHPTRPLAGYRAQVKELREENDRLEGILQAPLSLKDMEVAWENAGQSGECREGDTLVTRHSDDNYEVWVSVGAFDLGEKSRVLSRAPQREPWQDLADVLADMGHTSPTGHARDLHARGVRVTGGDEGMSEAQEAVEAELAEVIEGCGAYVTDAWRAAEELCASGWRKTGGDDA